MQSAPKSEEPVTPESTAAADLDAFAVASFAHRLRRAAMVRQRGPKCAARDCTGCVLSCPLWQSSN